MASAILANPNINMKLKPRVIIALNLTDLIFQISFPITPSIFFLLDQANYRKPFLFKKIIMIVPFFYRLKDFNEKRKIECLNGRI